MRPCLACYIYAAPFCLPDDRNTFLRGDVAHMICTACLLCQAHIARNLAPLALGANAPVAVGLCICAVVDIAAAKQAIVLAVRGQNFPKPSALLHRLAHQALRLYALSIVGKCNYLRGHRVQIRQLLALLPDGNCAVGVHMHAGAFPDTAQLLFQ